MRLIAGICCLFMMIIALVLLNIGDPIAMVVANDGGSYQVQPLFHPDLQRPLADGQFDDMYLVRWCNAWLSFDHDGRFVFYNYETQQQHHFPVSGRLVYSPSGRYLYAPERVFDVCNGTATDLHGAAGMGRYQRRVWHNDVHYFVGHLMPETDGYGIFRASIEGLHTLYTSDHELQFLLQGHTNAYAAAGDTRVWFKDGTRLMQFNLDDESVYDLGADVYTNHVYLSQARAVFHDRSPENRAHYRVYWQAGPDQPARLVWETHDGGGVYLDLYDQYAVWEGPGQAAYALDMNTGDVQNVADQVEYVRFRFPGDDDARYHIRRVSPAVHPWAQTINAAADVVFNAPPQHSLHSDWQKYCGDDGSLWVSDGSAHHPDTYLGQCADIKTNPAQTRFAFVPRFSLGDSFTVFDTERWQAEVVTIKGLPTGMGIAWLDGWSDAGLYFTAQGNQQSQYYMVQSDGTGLTPLLDPHYAGRTLDAPFADWAVSARINVGQRSRAKTIGKLFAAVVGLALISRRRWARRQAVWW